MTKPEFNILLLGVSYVSFKFAQEFLLNDLKPTFRYDLELNASNDTPEETQFETYPEDNGKKHYNLTDKEVVNVLYRNDKIPVWIDIAVYKSNEETTTFKLNSAGRYSDDKNEFYYAQRGSGPFGIKSPNLPFNYKKGSKFRI